MTGRRRRGESSPEDASPRDAPLSDLVDVVEARRKREEIDTFRTTFTEQRFEAVDGESIWEGPPSSSMSSIGLRGEGTEEGKRTYVVSKRNFCERCQYLSSPPSVHCTHEGTEIREFVDSDHVRVSSCPVVDEHEVGDDANFE